MEERECSSDGGSKGRRSLASKRPTEGGPLPLVHIIIDIYVDIYIGRYYIQYIYIYLSIKEKRRKKFAHILNMNYS